MSKPFTGRHMAIILVVFFGVVMGVNFTMARLASSTFGGIQVENSYVASQNYNEWLAAAREQDEWGWQIATQPREDGRLAILADGPGAQAEVSATLRHPLGRAPDMVLTFARREDGTFLSTTPVPLGRWIMRLEVIDAGRRWRREERLG